MLIYLVALGLPWDLHCGIGFSCSTTCGILVPRPRDQTHVSYIGRQILNHWTTMEVPINSFSKFYTKQTAAKQNMIYPLHKDTSKKENRYVQSDSPYQTTLGGVISKWTFFSAKVLGSLWGDKVGEGGQLSLTFIGS